jgi:ribosome-associated protein
MSVRRALRVRPDLVIAPEELREAATRSRGPGGQHVNKVSTRVTLRWNVTSSACTTPSQRRRLVDRLGGRLTRSGDLVVHCDRTRSRTRNREYARERIAELVAAALERRKPRRATKPTAGSRTRLRTEKTLRSEVKRRRGRVGPESE